MPPAWRNAAVAMALLGMASAWAGDTAVGVDTWIANKLDPNAGAALAGNDERGTSWLTDGPHRSPSGNLYQCPANPPDPHALGGWNYSGVLQIGYLGTGGDDHNALWNRYVEWRTGLVLGLLSMHFERPLDGSYADLRASRISAEDQYYELAFGRAGSYKVQAFVRDLPNVVSSTARPIWNGVGSNALTLAGGLVPGGSTPAEVAAVSAATPPRELAVQRDKQGLGYSGYLTPQWTSYFNVTDEQRHGERPFGGPMYFNYSLKNDGGVLETTKPIDDSTVNVNAGLRFSGRAWRLDFGYSGSFYRDAYTGFSYQTPFALHPTLSGATSAPLTQGQFATEPDNNYHSLRASLTRKLAMDGELSLSASGGRMSQNDTLIAPTNCQGVFGIQTVPTAGVGSTNPLLYSCSLWNTPAALSRPTAGLAIDTSMADARLVLAPSSRVTLRADARFNREDYRGTYVALNPLTGQYGYIIENGAEGSIVPGSTGIYDPILNPSAVTRVQSLPLDMQTMDADFGADFKASEHNILGATYAYRDYAPDHRERAHVEDNSVKLTWIGRSLDWLTLRANYTYLRQGGDRYNADPYEFLYSNSLPGFVAPAGGVPAYTVDAMRAYDLASRSENKFDVIATVVPHQDMTLSATLRGDDNNYDAQIGRQKYRTLGLSLQWEWQPSPLTSASVYYGYDRSRLDLANVDNASPSPDGSLGGPGYPDDGRWWARDREANQNAGFTLAREVGRVHLDANWNLLYSRGITSYRFATPAALAYFGDGTQVPGNVFPPMSYRINSVTLGMNVALLPRVTLRLYDYFERSSIADWHYLGFDQGQVLDHRVYTDGGPQGYSANLIGLLLNIAL